MLVIQLYLNQGHRFKVISDQTNIFIVSNILVYFVKFGPRSLLKILHPPRIPTTNSVNVRTKFSETELISTPERGTKVTLVTLVQNRWTWVGFTRFQQIIDLLSQFINCTCSNGILYDAKLQKWYY